MKRFCKIDLGAAAGLPGTFDFLRSRSTIEPTVIVALLYTIINHGVRLLMRCRKNAVVVRRLLQSSLVGGKTVVIAAINPSIDAKVSASGHARMFKIARQTKEKLTTDTFCKTGRSSLRTYLAHNQIERYHNPAK